MKNEYVFTIKTKNINKGFPLLYKSSMSCPFIFQAKTPCLGLPKNQRSLEYNLGQEAIQIIYCTLYSTWRLYVVLYTGTYRIYNYNFHLIFIFFSSKYNGRVQSVKGINLLFLHNIRPIPKEEMLRAHNISKNFLLPMPHTIFYNISYILYCMTREESQTKKRRP